MLNLIKQFALAALFASAANAQPAPVAEADISTEPYTFSADAPFASEIYNFFVQDELFPPTECRTVFTGSSSIRFWLTLQENFPDLNPLNRGFGGSEIKDVIGYFDILLTRHQPKEIVFYAGENDLNFGVSPAETVRRLEAFMTLKTDRLGDAPVYFLAIKPSIARTADFPAQTAANQLIQALAAARSDLTYVDIATPMMDGDTPKSIFISDQLHMNLDGYAIWTEVLSGILSDPERPVRTGCE